MWDKCIPLKFTKFICSREIFIQLSQPYISYQKANDIVQKFIAEDNENMTLLKDSLKAHINTIQYIYLLLFPKIYSQTNNFGIKNKSNFDFVLRDWQHKKKSPVVVTTTSKTIEPGKILIVTNNKQLLTNFSKNQKKKSNNCSLTNFLKKQNITQ